MTQTSIKRLMIFVLAGGLALWLGYSLNGLIGIPEQDKASSPPLVELSNGTALIGQEKEQAVQPAQLTVERGGLDPVGQTGVQVVEPQVGRQVADVVQTGNFVTQ